MLKYNPNKFSQCYIYYSILIQRFDIAKSNQQIQNHPQISHNPKKLRI